MKIKINNIVFDTVKVNDSDIPNFILEQIENDINEGEFEGGTIYTENPEPLEYNWQIIL